MRGAKIVPATGELDPSDITMNSGQLSIKNKGYKYNGPQNDGLTQLGISTFGE